MVNIIYYTDPLCCWSWAFEPHWQQLLDRYQDSITVRYCMAGLLESWKSYYDSENSVSKPVQMGPLWMQVGHMTGMTIDSTVWVKDPPASSYLACVAVKCAFMQSPAIGSLYLQLLRTEVMQNGRNISRQRTLLKLAELLESQCSGFNLELFKKHLVNGEGYDAFASDLREVRYRGISRFPTLAISNRERGMLLTGYRPYEVVAGAIEKLLTAKVTCEASH